MGTPQNSRTSRNKLMLVSALGPDKSRDQQFEGGGVDLCGWPGALQEPQRGTVGGFFAPMHGKKTDGGRWTSSTTATKTLTTRATRRKTLTTRAEDDVGQDGDEDEGEGEDKGEGEDEGEDVGLDICVLMACDVQELAVAWTSLGNAKLQVHQLQYAWTVGVDGHAVLKVDDVALGV